MPYDLRPFGNGKYKVCKKNSKKCFSKKPLPKARAEAQMKAIHANTNESLDTNAVGGKLTFAGVHKDNKGYFAKVGYTIAGHEGSKLDLYYKLGQNPDYKFFQIDGRTFEDPHDPETTEALHHFDLSGDDIEMAGQDGYDKVAEVASGFKFEESLSFESFFKTIMERHDNRLLSGCCGAPPSSLSDDICSECGEHAEFESEEE